MSLCASWVNFGDFAVFMVGRVGSVGSQSVGSGQRSVRSPSRFGGVTATGCIQKSQVVGSGSDTGDCTHSPYTCLTSPTFRSH